MTLKSLRARELPELDDEFAQAVNEASSVEELREQIRTDIHMGKTNDGRNGVVTSIINQMAEQAEIDPPAVMVDDEVDHQITHLKEDLQRSNTPWEGYLRLQNKTEDEVKGELRPEAERRLRNSLFLQEVATQEGIEISDEDIEAEITRIAGPTVTEGDPAAIDQAARMAQFYRSDYFQQMLRNELFERKLYDRLIEIATEGQGAVLNAYVAPEPAALDEAMVIDDLTVEVDEDGTVIVDEVIETIDADGTDVTEEIIDIVDADGNETIIDVVDAIDANGEEAAVAEIVEIDAEGNVVSDEVEVLTGEGYANAVAGDGANNVPDGYPVKGNADSMIYHTPESGSYERTIAEWYFATAEDAEAAGFRAPANMQGAEVADAASALAEAAAAAASEKAGDE